ncbi:MAG: hypothetical protein GXO50_06045 [Chlorobi bacterium]|nr:hypothetical protein [Chlorobiota bacterium]
MKFIYKIPIVISLAIPVIYNSTGNLKNNITSVNLYDNTASERECVFCHSNIVKHKVLHPPAESDCEFCHKSTGNKHPRVKLKGFVTAEKMPDLCYMCHDRNNRKYIHKPVKNGKCITCHSPHGSENPYMLLNYGNSEECLKCHDLKIEKNIHPPLELDGCASCHDAHQSDYPKLLVKKQTDLCAECHDDIKNELKETHKHPPFEDDCFNCHTPHSSDKSFLLTASLPGLCFSCHDEIKEKLETSENIHLVTEDKYTCGKCHSPHASSDNFELIKNADNLCLSCHNKEIKTGTKIIRNIDKDIKNSNYKHAALENGCTGCHNPHASDYNNLLTYSFPENIYVKASIDKFELCFNCHDEALLNNARTKTATSFRNGDNNLHYLHINGDKGRNCSVCHDIHASDDKFLIKQKTVFGEWLMPLNFTSSENGGSCRTGCHEKKEYNRINPVKYGL